MLRFAGDLARTHAVPAVHKQPKGAKPLVQTDGGILHHGSGLERELLKAVLLVALPKAGI
jgi:hypothetical protein